MTTAELETIAKVLFEKHCAERKARGLATVAWVDLNMSVRKHWGELVEVVVDELERAKAHLPWDGL